MHCPVWSTRTTYRVLIACQLLVFCGLAAIPVVEAISLEYRSRLHLDLVHDLRLPEGVQIGGLSFPGEADRPSGTRFLWGEGPRSVVVFPLPKSKVVCLTLACNNPIPGQDVVATANGRPLVALTDLAPHPWMAGAVEARRCFRAVAGVNVVALDYRYWNGHGWRNGDPRSLAMAYTALRLDVADYTEPDAPSGK